MTSLHTTTHSVTVLVLYNYTLFRRSLCGDTRVVSRVFVVWMSNVRIHAWPGVYIELVAL